MCEHHHHHHHEHEHGHCDNEQVALLEYMHHHNEHHLEEFHEVAESIRAQGKEYASQLLEEAIALLAQANTKLAASIAELKKEG